MFHERTLSPTLSAVHDEYAPDSTVLDVDTDFETLSPAVAEDLGLLADALDPETYPADWLPDTVPTVLQRYASDVFTIGMPGDGTVVWTRQTEPPTVLVKQRAEGTPDAFLSFLIAEAFVQLNADVPEHFLAFFGDRYRALDAAVPLGANDVYQIAAALFDGWVGLHTRETFVSWPEEPPYASLSEAWVDAGDRLEPRLSNLSSLVARGELSFPASTEYACSAIKHDLDLPTPFSALDTAAYRDHGSAYAVQWADKTFEKLAE